MRPDGTTPIRAPFKVCSSCGSVLPCSREFFYADKRGRHGLVARCKVCHIAAKREWEKRNPEKVHALQAQSRERNRESRRAQFRRYHAAHRDRINAHKREYMRQRGLDDPETTRERRRADYAVHSDSYKANARRRRAIARGADGRHTVDDVRSQLRRQRGRCYWCGEPTGDGYHIDHIVPLSRGGSDGPENIVIACATCNLRKYTKLPHEFSDHLC